MPGVEELSVSVDCPEPPLRIMLVGFREPVTPEGVVAESWTVPENPLTDDAVIVEVPEVPAKNVRELGLAESVKSTTLTMMVTAWVSEPLVPVTVMV